MKVSNPINPLMRFLGGPNSSRQTSVDQDPANSLIEIVVDSVAVPGQGPAELPVHRGQSPASLPK